MIEKVNMRHILYKLDGEDVIPITFDQLESGEEELGGNCQIATDAVGPYLVSTVFLRINHALMFEETRHPVLFETMVFVDKPIPKMKWWQRLFFWYMIKRRRDLDEKWDQHQQRYQSKHGSLAGHNDIVIAIRDDLDKINT